MTTILMMIFFLLIENVQEENSNYYYDDEILETLNTAQIVDCDLDAISNIDKIMWIREKGIDANTCTPYQILSLFLDSQFWSDSFKETSDYIIQRETMNKIDSSTLGHITSQQPDLSVSMIKPFFGGLFYYSELFSSMYVLSKYAACNWLNFLHPIHHLTWKIQINKYKTCQQNAKWIYTKNGWQLYRYFKIAMLWSLRVEMNFWSGCSCVSIQRCQLKCSYK